jgi:hypothetical protein
VKTGRGGRSFRVLRWYRYGRTMWSQALPFVFWWLVLSFEVYQTDIATDVRIRMTFFSFIIWVRLLCVCACVCFRFFFLAGRQAFV